MASAAVPVLDRTAQVVSGQAPQIDADDRKNKEKLEDEQLAVKEQQLTQQLEIGRKYGTLTPDQQQQYVDQITGLYSHPRHSGKLMGRLRQAIHPNGAYAQAPSAPLPNAVPPGGTQAADDANSLSQDQKKEDQKREQLDLDIAYMKKSIPKYFPNASPAEQQSMLNDFIEHRTGIMKGEPRTPKGLKAIDTGGIFMGIQDQDTGKQYLPSQLAAGGDAPPEAKTMWNEIQKAQKDKEAAADKKEKEAEERQTRSFAHAAQMVGLQMQKQIELGNIREAQSTFKDAEKSYRSAAELSQDMQKNAQAAKQGDQQAQIAILTDHAGGTTKLAGGRLTKPIMDELTGSLPFLEKVQKQWSTGPDGIQYLSGVTLSPDQVDRMLAVAQNRVSVMKDSLDGIRADHPEAFPQTPAKKVGGILPKTGAQPVSKPDDDPVNKFLKNFPSQ